MNQPSNDTPSVTPIRACQLPQRGSLEGAGNGWFHSSGCSLNRGVTGDFHRPYETLNVWDFTTHRTTLPQSALTGCQLPQRGSRERLRGLVPFNRVLAKIRGYGRFSSPLRNSKIFTLHRSTGGMGECLHNSRKKVDIITGKQEKIDFFAAICYNNTDR